MVGRSFFLGLAIVLCFSAAVGRRVVAQASDDDREYQIKLACLYNFGQYVDWPRNAVPGDDKTFVIGVIGPNPFGKRLDALATRTIRDKKIVVHRFASVKDYKPCHILFVSAGEDANAAEKTMAERIKAVVAKTGKSPVLLVGDRKGLAQKGMIIDLYIQDNKIKMEINRTAAKRVGLQISAKLLGLKKTVKIVEDSTSN